MGSFMGFYVIYSLRHRLKRMQRGSAHQKSPQFFTNRLEIYRRLVNWASLHTVYKIYRRSVYLFSLVESLREAMGTPVFVTLHSTYS